MPQRDQPGPEILWRKSSHSNNATNCVQMGADPDDGHVWVRNSNDPDGPAVRFTRPEIAAWLAGAADGEFNYLAA